MKAVKIYYHVAQVGGWESILNEQINLIHSTGLYNLCEDINVGFLGDLSCIEPYITGKIKLAVHDSNLKRFEAITINMMLEHASNNVNQYDVLYIHTKGAGGVIRNDINGQYYWRQMMNYWMIEQHLTCIDYLRLDYATCGINSIPKRNPTHYSGNFWWSSSDYIRNLSPLNGTEGRGKSESWLLDNSEAKKYKHISLYGPYISSKPHASDSYGLYGMILERDNYIKSQINTFYNN